MTSLLDPPADAGTDLAPEDLDRLDLEPDAEQPDEATVAPATVALAVVSGALSAGGAAWMIGGVFRGTEARLVGFLGVLLGATFVYLGTRWRSSVVQYLTMPAALLVGAVLMSSSSGSGSSSLPALVKDAATASQLLQPPIDVAPGWRLILVVLLALLTSAACALALSTGRLRLAVAVPAPLTVAAALIQPSGTAIATSAVSVGFVLMALATSYAADGAGETFDAGFELRRLGRSAVAGVLLVAALVGASKLSFLFPEDETTRVIPPRRPPISPPQPDVPLYVVKGELTTPLRAGVIDVYDEQELAWLLPPVDTQRLQRLDLPADVPGAGPARGATSTVTVTVKEARGRTLPSLAGTRRVEGSGEVDHDPRTQALSLAQRPVFSGLEYRLVVDPLPSGKQLSDVDGPLPESVKEFLEVPPVPPSVEALLLKAPQAPFARLQSVRAALYKSFTAAGQGKPTDVSPDRVVELLAGGTGNPYELTASEALLARWAGVPARIGFGYFNGRPVEGGIELRPTDAATYLEAYFPPYGWVPIVGTPPKAQQSLSDNSRNSDPSIQASPELGIEVLLPVRNPNRLPLHAYARYYLVRVLPAALLVGLLLLTYPVVLKRVRRRRRAAWAAQHGPAGAVAVAYGELRDRMIDLALPGRGLTPLELVELVDEDEEHAELAWLVTRGLWGDLRGSLTEEDARVARELSTSVTSRLGKAQPETARLLAAVSRASLRQPWSRELPNAWWQVRLRGRLPRPLLVVRRLRPGTATALVAVLGVLTLSGCSSDDGKRAEPSLPFPTRIAPTVLAGLQGREEPKAADAYAKGAKDRNVVVSEGKVVSFSRNGLVQAALQVAQLKRGYVASDEQVVRAITRSVGKVKELAPQSGHELYALLEGSQRIYLWFPTEKAMALLVLRSQIDAGAAEAMARALVDYGDGREIDERALAAAFATVGQRATEPTPVIAPTPTPEQSP